MSNFITFTNAENKDKPFLLDEYCIESINPCGENDEHSMILTTSGRSYFVRESIEEIKPKLDQNFNF